MTTRQEVAPAVGHEGLDDRWPPLWNRLDLSAASRAMWLDRDQFVSIVDRYITAGRDGFVKEGIRVKLCRFVILQTITVKDMIATRLSPPKRCGIQISPSTKQLMQWPQDRSFADDFPVSKLTEVGNTTSWLSACCWMQKLNLRTFFVWNAMPP